jgi:formylglycine-generating enzyme required for sulfatase activity
MRSMRGAMCAALMVFGMLAVATTVSAQGSAPVVSNVVAQQIPGTGNVRVTYDVSDPDGDSVSVSVIFSSNNGTTYDMLPRTISGDVSKRIAPGAGKVVTWAASSDFPGLYYPQVVAKVIANDGVMASSEMVLVPGGSTAPYSSPAYVSSYLIDKFEVTNAEFQRFIDAGGYSTRAYWSAEGWNRRVQGNWTAPSGWNVAGSYVGASYPGFPVSGVSWYEAEAYANFVGKRLSTEVEWEKACGLSSGRDFAWGDTLDPRRANYLNNGDPNDNFPTPVGFFNGTLYQAIFQTRNSPSPFGAYDLMGNMAEWVRDWHPASGEVLSSYPSGPVDPVGVSSGQYKILRGGSYASLPQYMYARYGYYRYLYLQGVGNIQFVLNEHYADPSRRVSNIGFRLVRPVTQ